MQIRVQVYLDGLRDTSHHADGMYAGQNDALNAVMCSLKEPAVSEVRLIKMASGERHD